MVIGAADSRLLEGSLSAPGLSIMLLLPFLCHPCSCATSQEISRHVYQSQGCCKTKQCCSSPYWSQRWNLHFASSKGPRHQPCRVFLFHNAVPIGVPKLNWAPDPSMPAPRLLLSTPPDQLVLEVQYPMQFLIGISLQGAVHPVTAREEAAQVRAGVAGGVVGGP